MFKLRRTNQTHLSRRPMWEWKEWVKGSAVLIPCIPYARWVYLRHKENQEQISVEKVKSGNEVIAVMWGRMRKTGNRIRIFYYIIHFVQSTSTTYKTALEHDAATTVLKVSAVFLGLKTSPLLIQTNAFLLWPKSSIFVSSDHKSLLQKALVHVGISVKLKGVSFGAVASFSGRILQSTSAILLLRSSQSFLDFEGPECM